MNRDTVPVGGAGCARVRALLHEAMDRALAETERRGVDRHVATCDGCADVAAGLEEVRRTLASLPPAPFPEDALREVFARTVDAGKEAGERGSVARLLRPVLSAAAAAVLAAVAIGLGGFGDRRPEARDLARADEAAVLEALERTRYALAIASDAVRRSERAALDGVMRRTVAPALHRIPVRFPDRDEGTRRAGA